MEYQWYPGHMTKALRQMREDLKLIDLVIELTDARVPVSSRNPDIDTLSAGKARLLLLNKADLADEDVNREWMEHFTGQGLACARINAQRGEGIRQLQPLILKACEKKIAQDQARGIKNRPIRALVCGIPNVGKSTLINSMAGRASAKTGNKPGVTKGKQWIRISKSLELLDTPGILWPKFEDRIVGENLALVGTIREEIISAGELGCTLIERLRDICPGALTERYGVSEEGESWPILQQIALARGCVKKGQIPDEERAASLLLSDFRGGRLGRISLERP